ncbi:MAG: class I SAM-dependent methyltransferase [Bdellovibrionales bacterium]|nr:class I SAM-dependent methyltransferase [Bdellovibrionales bacterium]
MLQQDANIQLQSRLGSTGLRGEIDISRLDPMAQFNIEHTEGALLTALASGILLPEQVRGKVVDFGCGSGVSTALLRGFGADVTGVEVSGDMIETARELGFVPTDRIVHGDGIAYLRSLPQGSIDFVYAAMLGPDTQGILARDLLLACKHALNPRGAIVITSDAGTLSALHMVNPLGNGYFEGHVFLAFRGIDQPSESSPLAKFAFSEPETGTGGETRDFRKIYEGLDLEALLRSLGLKK